MVKTKKKKPVDVELIKKLIEESGVSIFRIETDVKIGNGIISRGLKPNPIRAIPPKWELPIIKYLKKKIAEKVDIELQTEEVKKELGFLTPEKESNLKEEQKEVKRKWIEKLQS